MSNDGTCNTFTGISGGVAGFVFSFAAIVGIGVDNQSSSHDVGDGAAQLDDIVEEVVVGSSRGIGA